MVEMTSVPRLSIGLPTYNGESFLAESLDALLGQSYENFELIISDNASTDGTEDICRRYAKQDSRIRYIRQSRNIGCAPNHNVLVRQARGELFKWASDDDLYARDLIERCIEALDEYPNVVLAHSWTAMIDSSRALTKAVRYPLASASPRAPERFRSMLFEKGGDDDGGVIRMDILRRVRPYDSYLHSDRTLVTEICLQGPFYQVPDWLYFRRDHPDASLRAFPGMRSNCTNLDPRRAGRLRHPAPRLVAEYIWAFMTMIHRAPLSRADQRECYGHLASWAASRAVPRSIRGDEDTDAVPEAIVSVEAVVASASRGA
jgi:glycosyltransferase involved in cell wall biosynthesis